jgi:hypothetical protein
MTPQEREAFVSGAVAAIGAAVVELHGSEAAEILDELLPLPAIVDTVRTHIHYSVHLQSYDPKHCCVHRRQSILAHDGLKARDNKHRFRPMCQGPTIMIEHLNSLHVHNKQIREHGVAQTLQLLELVSLLVGSGAQAEQLACRLAETPFADVAVAECAGAYVHEGLRADLLFILLQLCAARGWASSWLSFSNPCHSNRGSMVWPPNHLALKQGSSGGHLTKCFPVPTRVALRHPIAAAAAHGTVVGGAVHDGRASRRITAPAAQPSRAPPGNNS